MFMTEKQIFLAYLLVIWSLSLAASEQNPGFLTRARNWVAGQPQPRPLNKATEIHEALKDIIPWQGPLDIIQEYAEDYLPYKIVRSFPSYDLLQHLAFDDDNQNLTVVSIEPIGQLAHPNTIVLYDIQTGNITKKFTANLGYRNPLLSGNGKILISLKDIYDTITGTIIDQVPDIPVPNHPGALYAALSLNYDGSILVLAPPKQANSAPLIFWNVITKALINADSTGNPTFAYTSRYSARHEQDKDQFLKFSRDGTTFACPFEENNSLYIVLLDVATGQKKRIIPLHVAAGKKFQINPHARSMLDVKNFSIALNDDASLLAYALQREHESEAYIIDTLTGKVAQNLTSQQGSGLSSLLSRQPSVPVSKIVGFSHDNNVYIMTAIFFPNPSPHKLGNTSWSLQLWNTESGFVTKIINFETLGTSTIPPILTLSSDDHFIALKSSQDTIELLKQSTQTEIDQEEREKRREEARELEMQQDAQRIEQERLHEQRQRNLETLGKAPNIQTAITRQIATQGKGLTTQTPEVQESPEAQSEKSEDVTKPAVEELD